MLSRNHPDGIHIAFDDHRLVNTDTRLPCTSGGHAVRGHHPGHLPADARPCDANCPEEFKGKARELLLEMRGRPSGWNTTIKRTKDSDRSCSGSSPTSLTGTTRPRTSTSRPVGD